jgi:hypothetical protein
LLNGSITAVVGQWPTTQALKRNQHPTQREQILRCVHPPTSPAQQPGHQRHRITQHISGISGNADHNFTRIRLSHQPHGNVDCDLITAPSRHNTINTINCVANVESQRITPHHGRWRIMEHTRPAANEILPANQSS